MPMAHLFRQESSPDQPEEVDAGCVRSRRLGNCGGSGPLQSKDRSGYRCDDQRQCSRPPNVVLDITSGVPTDVHRERGAGDRMSMSWSEDDSVDVIKAEAYRQAVLAMRNSRPVSPWHPSPLGVSGEGSGGWHGRYPDSSINSSEGATSQSNSPLTSPKMKPNLMVLSEESGNITEVYNIKEKIGEGHSGIVNVVENRLTGDLFACKSLNKKRMKGSKVLAELRSEIKAMLEIGPHQNAVELRDVLEDEKEVHLVMDYYEKGDLFDHLAKRGRVGETEAAFIIRQLASVLQFAHGREYAHQDVKPENVFISAMRIMQSDKGFVQVPDVKLGDWGLAQHLPEGKRGVRVVGSCIYMAPEVVAGDYGCEIDIWSLGVTLYVALSGYLPFWAKSNEGIFAAIQKACPDYSCHPWPLLSPQAKSLVQWMLHSDPATRITAGGILAHPWIISQCNATPLRCILTSPRTPLTSSVDIHSKLLPAKPTGDAATTPPSQQFPRSDASESRVPSPLRSPRVKLTRPQYRSCEATTLTSLDRKSSGEHCAGSGPLSPSRPLSPGPLSSGRRRLPPSPPLNLHPHPLPHPQGASPGFATAPIPPFSPLSPHALLPALLDVAEDGGFTWPSQPQLGMRQPPSTVKEVGVEDVYWSEVAAAAAARCTAHSLRDRVQAVAGLLPTPPTHSPPAEMKKQTMQEIFSSFKKISDIVPSLHRAGSGMVGSGDSSLSATSSPSSRESSTPLPVGSPVTPLDWKISFGLEGNKAPSPSPTGKVTKNSIWKMAGR